MKIRKKNKRLSFSGISFLNIVNVIIFLICFSVKSVPMEADNHNTHGPGSHTEESESIKVPEGNGNPVLLDGIFSPGEWEDAKKINVSQNLSLYLKKYKGHIFIGVRLDPYKTFVVNLFISPDGKTIYQLHTSAQIGERLINDSSTRIDNPSFIWGYSVDWYANEIRWDNGKMQALIKEGKSRDDAQKMTFFRSDGYEFQIKQSKFSSDQWLFRIDVPIAPDFDNPIIFPSNTKMTSTEGWMILELD